MQAILMLLLTLKVGPEALPSAPVRFVVDGPLAACSVLEVRSQDGNLVGYAQKDGKEFVFIAPALEASQEATYTLTEAKDYPVRVLLSMADHKIDVRVDGALFTSYNYQPDQPKPYLYPVIIGDGLHLTRAYPMENVETEGEKVRDHVHHTSWWVAYGEVNESNFWMAQGDHGQQKPREILEVVSGPVFGKFRAVNDWNRPDGVREIQEEREYIFYAQESSDRLTDMRVTFSAVDHDIVFHDTKEGGICSLRMNPLIDEEHGNGRMANSEGKATEAECWGKPASWCDYSGNLNGQNVGIAVLDHPANLRHPSRWHIRAYGLYTANPFGLKAFGEQESGDYSLPKGQDLNFNYRVLMHLGNTEEARIGSQYRAYATPPSAAVKVK